MNQRTDLVDLNRGADEPMDAMRGHTDRQDDSVLPLSMRSGDPVDAIEDLEPEKDPSDSIGEQGQEEIELIITNLVSQDDSTWMGKAFNSTGVIE